MTYSWYYILLSIFLLILSCDDNTNASKVHISTKDSNHFPNIIQVQQLGDTMRLEIEKKRDTLVKHYIDLKGTKGDNFDDSYNVVCTYERRNVDSTVVINKKEIRIKALLTENYQTEFSKGKNFFFITRIGDTIFNVHVREYIN